MSIAEISGYGSASLVFMTFYMKTMAPLRIVAMCSNCAFIIYGYLDGLYPVLILHLVPLNSLRLREILNLTKQVREARHGDPNMDWIKPFTSRRYVQSGEVVANKGETAVDTFVVMSGHFQLVETDIELVARDVVGEFALLTPTAVVPKRLNASTQGYSSRSAMVRLSSCFFRTLGLDSTFHS